MAARLPALAAGLALAALAACSEAAKDVSDAGDRSDYVSALKKAGGSSSMVAAVQGALMLSAALPQHDAVQATKAQEDQMQKAAPLVFSSYNILKSAEANIDASLQQMKTGIDMGSSSQGIAQGEVLLKRGEKALTEGESLLQKAETDFMNSADPLGPQPTVPKEWEAVEGTGNRAKTKLNQLKRKLSDAKRRAKDSGVSLISVAQEETHVFKNAYGDQEDDKVLDFLSHY